MDRSFDPAAGQVDVFPQEITRALLNLISNGFYAATKRKEQDDTDGYEPTLVASTKNLGDCVEITICDNGTGIPPEVKDKMFNPFFTTKPAGEGTGLGLSITHDIIVKQHGGSIEVDTQPGEYTEVRIVLPRVAAFIAEFSRTGVSLTFVEKTDLNVLRALGGGNETARFHHACCCRSRWPVRRASGAAEHMRLNRRADGL